MQIRSFTLDEIHLLSGGTVEFTVNELKDLLVEQQQRGIRRYFLCDLMSTMIGRVIHQNKWADGTSVFAEAGVMDVEAILSQGMEFEAENCRDTDFGIFDYLGYKNVSKLIGEDVTVKHPWLVDTSLDRMNFVKAIENDDIFRFDLQFQLRLALLERLKKRGVHYLTFDFVWE